MSDDNYCDTHDVNIGNLAKGETRSALLHRVAVTVSQRDTEIDDVAAYDNCPYCEMRREQAAMERERAMRHAPRSVDDPASIDAYRN